MSVQDAKAAYAAISSVDCPTSANPHGYKSASAIIDEFTFVIALQLTFSCFFSFISIRTKNPNKEQRLETIADYLFIVSPTGILLIILLLVFNFIK